MKLGIVCSPTFGGSGVAATELGLQLAGQGHEVHFISYEKPQRLLEYQENVFFHEVSNDPYPLFHVHPYALALASTLAEVIEERDLDILHVHYAIPHAVSAILARQICPNHTFKLITTLHGTDITLVGQSRSYFPLTKLAIEQSDGVTAVSQYLKKQTLETFQVNQEIEVIANSIDLNRFRPQPCEQVKNFRSQFSQDCKIISHVSNFRPVKRVQDVIEIFSQIQKKVPSHLVMVGDGPERTAAKEKVCQLNLQENVTFLGSQHAVEVVYAASDLFLLPSEHESFGLSALEALACGCPVVGTSGSGMQEFIENEKEGFLAGVGDVNAMAEGAVRILQNIKTFQQAGISKAQQYDLVLGAKVYESYYRRILG